MYTKIIVLFLLSVLLVNQCEIILVSAEGIPDSMQIAFNEIMEMKSDWLAPIEAFDIDIWNQYDILVMDIPGEFPSNLAKIKTADGSFNHYNTALNEYRYIGKNPDGYLVNNPRYPDDHSGTVVINTYDWQVNRDNKTQIYQFISTPEDQKFYENEIFYFLEQEYGERFDETSDPGPWLDNAIVIIPVSSTGDGVIKYLHKWDSDSDGTPEDWYITVNLRAKDEVVPVMASEITYELVMSEMEPLSATRIASDERGEEIFDVTQGIPTGEELYVNVSASEYIYSDAYLKVAGTFIYEVTVNKDYRLWRWNEAAILNDLNGDGDFDDPGETLGDWESRIESVAKTYSVNRPYSYYEIDELNIYSLSGAVIHNEAISGGQVTLSSSVGGPEIEVDHQTDMTSHLQPPRSSESVSIRVSTEDLGKVEGNLTYPSVPNESLRSQAENAVDQVLVRNDSLVFDGHLVLDDSWVEADGSEPASIPQAPLNPSGDLYMEKMVIDHGVTNGLKPSRGSITYDLAYSLKGGAALTHSLSIDSINDVMVHTPVVCNPELNEISRETQLIDPDEDVFQLVLEESFHLDFDFQGRHLMIPGYGDNDYGKYTLEKQVRFPFDVYIGEDYEGLFLPKNTWGNFTSLENTFFVPSWVEEGDGYILFRSLANNIPSVDHEAYEYNANLDPNVYKAVEAIPFHIDGKIHSLMVTDCGDDFWLNKFKETPLYVGFDIDGSGVKAISEVSGSLDEENLLPLMPGKTHGEEDESLSGVMLGYGIDFQLITNGQLGDRDDYIYIETRFDYVPDVSGHPDMSGRIPVDLYVSEFGQIKPYDHPLVLDETMRTLIGPEEEKDPTIPLEDKEASVQLWSGQFFLPNMTYAVPMGTDLSLYRSLNLENEPFLHDGYIIVNFNVVVFDQLSLSDDLKLLLDKNSLSYEEANRLRAFFENQNGKYTYSLGWDHEGYDLIQKGINLKAGDIMFYSTDQRAGQTYY